MQIPLKNSFNNINENIITKNDDVNPSNNLANNTSVTASSTASIDQIFMKEISDQTISIQKNNFKYDKEIFISKKIRWAIFSVLMILQIMMNVDHGTVPAALEEIRKDLEIQDDLLGTFASLVFLGNLIGSLLSLTMINRVSRKFLLAISLFFNSVCLFTYAIIKIKWILFANRIFVGIFQAYIAIYLPVWCDQFGIGNKKSIMISLIQVGSMVGVVIGYFMTFDIKKRSEWTFSFTIQSLVIFILFLIISIIPSIYFTADLTVKKKKGESNKNLNQSKNGSLNVNVNESLIGNKSEDKNLPENLYNNDNLERHSQENLSQSDNSNYEYDDCVFVYNRLHENDESKSNSLSNTNMNKINSSLNHNYNPAENDSTINNILNFKNELYKDKENKNHSSQQFLKNLRIIFSEKVFVFSTIALSTLFFVVTAVQYWITNYMQEVLKIEDIRTIIFIFIMICVTAPTLGLLMGGAACTYIGGYETKNSILLCFLFAFCASPFSILVPLANSIIAFAIFLWFVIFFGAAIFPTLTGVILSSLPVELRGLGYSINGFFANLFGYIPAPYVYGLINYLYKKENERMAFTSIMTYPILCLVLISLATYFRYKKFESQKGREIDIETSRGEIEISESSQSSKTIFKEMELIDIPSSNISERNDKNFNDVLSPSKEDKILNIDEIEVDKFRKISEEKFSDKR